MHQPASVRGSGTRLLSGVDSGLPAARELWSRWWPAAAVFLAAIAMRLVCAALTANTFDPDEFVIVALSRSLAHGATLYRDVTYFHPPGLLMLFAAFQQVMAWWWPSGRILTLLFDSVTAV